MCGFWKAVHTNMVSLVNHHDPHIAEQIYHLQQASYKVERDLIAYPDFPPLRVTATDIQQEDDTFLGVREGEKLVGILSYTATSECLDIGRLIVHPSVFRRGIASQLLIAVKARATVQLRLSVSTAENNHPAVALYQKHGYVIHERRTLPDGLALVRLSKDIRPEGRRLTE
jgi:ribosomal protein S18 acetylase RimI-like enzyme